MKKFILFDMDGVLLKPGGYQQAFKASLRQIGAALGAPNSEITSEQIAHFEALSVTNEWDSLAICTALILIHVWRFNDQIRLTAPITPRASIISPDITDIQSFLDTFGEVGHLPALSAYQKLSQENPELNREQTGHLRDILYNCRDIYSSLTLPIHQEAVLGSQTFLEHYNLKPQLNLESYLLKYDRPLITAEQKASLRTWLNGENHHAGILTNRPNATPAGYVSAPEAEIGAKLVGLDGIPILGSGVLNWYAETQAGFHAHTFLKPNPVHSLALMQICLGRAPLDALEMAVDLWQGRSDRDVWIPLNNASVIIYEDSVKGFQSGIAAQLQLNELNIPINLKLMGVSDNSTKIKSLSGIADEIVPSLKQHHWPF